MSHRKSKASVSNTSGTTVMFECPCCGATASVKKDSSNKLWNNLPKGWNMAVFNLYHVNYNYELKVEDPICESCSDLLTCNIMQFTDNVKRNRVRQAYKKAFGKKAFGSKKSVR